MKRMLKVLLVLLVAFMPFVAVSAKTTKTTTKTTEAKSTKVINFYVFYGNGCPHCEDLLNYIAELDKDKNYNTKYNLVKYETWYNQENATFMTKVFNYFGVTDTKQMGVPLYVIGDEYFTGFPSPATASEEQLNKAYNEIKNAIDKAYNNEKYVDVVAGIGSGTIDPSDAQRSEEDAKKTNNIIGYVILGVVVLIVIAIVFGRSKSDIYYPTEESEDDEDETKEEKEEAIKEEKVEAVEVETKTTAKKTTKKSATKATSTKKTTSKKNTKKKGA